MTEAERPLAEYKTIEEVFTRRLAPGHRPIFGPVCSPADGIVGRSCPVKNGHEATQIKGFTYSLREVVYGETADVFPCEPFGWFFTVYLAPHNYHRVHTPCSGEITTLRYLPGELWPVNPFFAARIPRLFTRNERLVFDIRLVEGGLVHVAMIGALNVGRIATPQAPDFVTNNLDRQLGARPTNLPLETPIPVTAGEEIGVFMLGSTVIVVFDELAAKRFPLVQIEENHPILMGNSMLQG